MSDFGPHTAGTVDLIFDEDISPPTPGGIAPKLVDSKNPEMSKAIETGVDILLPTPDPIGRACKAGQELKDIFDIMMWCWHVKNAVQSNTTSDNGATK